MLYRIVRPVKRKESSHIQFVQRIPADIKARAVGLSLAIPIGNEVVVKTITPRASDIRLSLRTRDPSEAKVRQAGVAAYLENVWRALRQAEPVSLTHKEATALAGELYRAWADETRERRISLVHNPKTGEWERADDDTGAGAEWEATQERWAALEHADLEPVLGPLVDRLLLAKGIGHVDTRSRNALLQEFWRALRDAFASRKHKADGDYRPDPNAERFPTWEPPREPKRSSLLVIVEDWWQETKAAGGAISTYESYRNTVKRFVAFLKHGDATRATPEDVIRYKDHRLKEVNPRTGRTISPKTIKDNDLAGLKVIFAWAVANRRVSRNPAEGITLKLGKSRRVRSKGFTEDEAGTILRHALDYKKDGKLGSEHPKTVAAKRWAPWLCAYTGARLGEILQLRKQDVRRHGKHWSILITPEAGTVKTKEAREVPLHSHLIALGFAEFAKEAANGHLFLTPSKNGETRGAWRSAKNRVTEFVREVVSDPNVAPNHGWRHLLKTIGFEAGIQERVLDAICGHAPRTVGASYGDVTIKTKIAALKKFPRFTA